MSAGGQSPRRPQPGDRPFHKVPLAETYGERQRLFLDWATEHPTPDDLYAIWAEICKLARGAAAIAGKTLDFALEFVDARRDCADFIVAGLIRALYCYGQNLPGEQREAIARSLLGFQYWLDEPNPNLGAMELWTENHQILIHSSEYLAGQLFPDQVFANGITGRERMVQARERICKWIDWRVRTGFAEWDSIPYYPEDLAALLNLADFAQDQELARQATMLVDLILFDVAVDSFYGQYGSSHGRAYDEHIKSAAGDTMVTLQALLWGMGRFQTNSNMGSVAMATSSYQMPAVLEAIGQDMPDEMTNRERHSIEVEAAADWDLHFDSDEDIRIWWAMGAFTHPKVIKKTMELAGRWQFWHYSDFRPFRALARVLGTLGLLGFASRVFDPDPNGVLMSEVNKLTFRTPDYMLSNAQDWRKGQKGYQQHIWQATLGPYAVVFVTNPDSLEVGDANRHRPSYWASHGRLPRTAQYRNVLVAVHKIPARKGLLEARHYTFTHAYFPRWAFDELVEVPAAGGGGWIFGRKDEGYIAFYSHLPYQWQQQGIDADQEVIAPGRENIWITHLGRRAVDGNFTDFVHRVSRAPLTVDGLQVEYEAPGVGCIHFGWHGPLTVNGAEVSLRDYPRWDNPYAQVPFDSREFTIEHNGLHLHLNFPRSLRQFNSQA
ncbi:MAG: hypothetical protein FH749_13395 [Firmicutes bacterium]|nr:hypothetical protein [Bacillota bacterium]